MLTTDLAKPAAPLPPPPEQNPTLCKRNTIDKKANCKIYAGKGMGEAKYMQEKAWKRQNKGANRLLKQRNYQRSFIIFISKRKKNYI